MEVARKEGVEGRRGRGGAGYSVRQTEGDGQVVMGLEAVLDLFVCKSQQQSSCEFVPLCVRLDRECSQSLDPVANSSLFFLNVFESKAASLPSILIDYTLRHAAITSEDRFHICCRKWRAGIET
eukprot:537257-Hanusia_phi.AAC.1